MYTLPVGTKISSPTTTYTITGVLGQGGFGITYSASVNMLFGSLRVKANVALKEHFVKSDCLRVEGSTCVSCSDPARQRVELTRKDFVGEARRLKKLSGLNPNIVSVNEVFEANDTAYYAMEMLDGVSLRDYVASCGHLPEGEMLGVMIPIVEAVAFLHRNHITHLDIKPHNIMIVADEDGKIRPVLIDFGLSKHYDESGQATSTINSRGFSDGYAPIEQYSGITTFSPASDVYSLAATMVYCLIGERLPKALDLRAETLEAAIPANISSKLRRTLLHALSLHAEDRQADASELLANIGEMRATVPMSTQHLADDVTVVDAQPIQLAMPKAHEKLAGKINSNAKKKSSVFIKMALFALVACIVGFGVWYVITRFNHPSTKSSVEQSELAESNKVELVPIIQNGKAGFADKDGKVVIPCEYDFVANFSEGLAQVANKNGNLWKCGFIDESGNIVVPLNYADAHEFKEGMAAVRKVTDGVSKHGFVDNHGKEVVPCKYDYTDSFNEGLAWVRKDGKYGYVDKLGYEVVQPIYDDASTFSDGLAWVKKDGKYGCIDKSGSEVIPFKYDGALEFNEGLALVLIMRGGDAKIGFIDKTGFEVIPIIYNFLTSFSEGRAWVGKDGKYGCVDTSGNVVIQFIYDYASEFSEGLAYVRKDGKYGYVDKSGNEVVPLIYDDASTFSDGLASVSHDGRYGYIDKSGTEVIPLIYDETLPFQDGLAAVLKGNKWGCIDASGTEVVPIIYDRVNKLAGGLLHVNSGAKTYYVDKWGNTMEISL